MDDPGVPLTSRPTRKSSRDRRFNSTSNWKRGISSIGTLLSLTLIISALLALTQPGLGAEGESGPYSLVDVQEGDPLNVRSTPNADDSKNIVGKLAAGTQDIYIAGKSFYNGGEEWLPIRAGKIQGWVRSKFIERKIPLVPTTSDTNVAGLKPDQPPDFSYLSKEELNFVVPSGTFDFQVSPLPTRPVDAALLGKWSYDSDDKFTPLEMVFSVKDKTHYEVAIKNDTDIWPRKTLAWHSDFLDQSFITILIPHPSKTTYAIFGWNIYESGQRLSLTQLSLEKVTEFESMMAARGWVAPNEVGFSSSNYPGSFRDATQFRTIVRQLLRRKNWAADRVSDLQRELPPPSESQAVENYLRALKGINDFYFMSAAYRTDMKGYATGWKCSRLFEVEAGPWATSVPAAVRECVSNAIIADYTVANLQHLQSASGIKNLEFLHNWPQHLGAFLGDKKDKRNQDLDLMGGFVRQAAFGKSWEAYTEWRANSTHEQDWGLAVRRTAAETKIPEPLRLPELTLPSYHWFTNGNKVDIFPYANNCGAGRNGGWHKWPDYNSVPNLGSVKKGPIKIILGPWEQLSKTGVTVEADNNLRVNTVASCDSGHFGYQRTEANEGWNSRSGFSSWVWAGGVDPLTQGATSGFNGRMFLGICHAPLGPFGATGAATGSITIFAEGQNPDQPVAVFKIGASGRLSRL